MKINELPVLESIVNELDPLTAGDLSDEDSVKSAILNAHWINPINPGLLALELTLGGGVFHPPSITPLSLTLDCSNFAQSYFQIG